MEWEPADTNEPRLTLADIADRWEVSESTLHRRRRSGSLPSANRTGHGRRWTFDATEVGALAETERWPAKKPETSQDQPDNQSQTDHPDQSDQIELGELRARVETLTTDLDRTTAERDRARSDHEHERQRADIAERQAIEHRTRSDAVTEHRDDLSKRLDRAETSTKTMLARIEALETAAHPPDPIEADPNPKRTRLSRWIFG